MWQPEDESLKMLVELLNESQVPDNAKQAEIHNKITELNANPEFSSYLVYILAISDNPNINILRRIAGATLKGVIERHFDKITSQSLEYIKLKLMEAFNDPATMIRNIVTNAITALLTKIGFQNWPELMKFLILNLDVDHQEFLESSLECTYKILEDIKVHAENFDYQDEKYQSFIGELIPKLFYLCDPKLPPRIKAIALNSLNLFVYSMPQNLYNNFGTYVDVLIISSADQSNEVRQKSCEGFLEIIETKKHMIGSNLQKVVEKLVQFVVDIDTDVKKIACRFWNEYLTIEGDEAMERIEVLKNYLEVLVPALVVCLQYTEEDLLNEEEVNRFSKQEAESLENGVGEETDKLGNQGLWTLRREAGKTLDKMAKRYREEIFLKAQEKIAESLRSSDWHIKESGIMCLGALTDGAYNAIVPHLKELFPFLMTSLEDQHALVRSISCWALSKLSSWILEQGKLDQTVIHVYLQKILQKMMEENSKVQEASCSALCKIAYLSPGLLEQHIYDIIDVIKYIYEHYQKKSLINLYDLIAALSTTIPKEKLQDEHLQNTILEILIKKWSDSYFNDRESIYLVECTNSILTLLGQQSIAHSDFFVTRLLFLIAHYIQAKKTDDKKYLYHKKEIAVRSFDLLGTFLIHIGPQMEKYLSPDDYLKIFHECIQDPDLSIKRVTLASGGEIAKYCPSILQGRIEKIVQSYMDNLFIVSEEYDAEGLIEACCNNSAWAIGEIALAFPSEFTNYIPQFVNRICDLFNSENLKVNFPLDQNLSIAIGRLGLVNPDAVAVALEQFLKPFCDSLNKLKNDPEKQEAFRGLFLSISKNPNGIVKDFMVLCDALVNFENAEADLQELALKLIINFKVVAGQYWDNYFVNFPKDLQEKMKLRFGI